MTAKTFIAAFLCTLALIGCSPVEEKIENDSVSPISIYTHTSVKVFIDPETKCHYLVYVSYGGIYPRYDSKGQIMCPDIDKQNLN